ncbi:hypothetical protein N7541_003055 [Penicillium brevicompactum]|uniref:Uncharacterized protein n=1 Tax=Penicillium brevicompactum TaxID=5074 RepID=A0A9W9RLK0_PENBR|nr:hypothetical protein N7541_003055 [Penicillium brevicompactum]
MDFGSLAPLSLGIPTKTTEGSKSASIRPLRQDIGIVLVGFKDDRGTSTSNRVSYSSEQPMNEVP